jgi:N-acetylmuramoyl-L-alanine amidase
VAVAPRAKDRKKTSKVAATDVPSAHEAEPTSAGERSLTRALGLKIGRIVVDAGHGGHDTGTIGSNGLMEKDLVLDVALRLGRLLETRLGADVIYTRDDDTFIPLETRTAVANEHQADLGTCEFQPRPIRPRDRDVLPELHIKSGCAGSRRA